MIIVAIDLFLVAPLTAWLANERGRSPTVWFVISAVAGPLALLAVGLGPSRPDAEESARRVRRCPECDTRVTLIATRCPACRAKLPAPIPEPAPEVRQEPERRPEPESAVTPEPDVEPEPEPQPLVQPGPDGRPRAVRGRASSPPGRPEPPQPVIVTRVTRRGADAPARPAGADEAEDVAPDLRGSRNLASGVFAGGSPEMVVGYRYMISVTARQLQISGPVDVAPDKIVFRAPSASVEAAALQNDIVIGAEPNRGRRVQLVFRGVAGGQGDRLVAALDHVTERTSKRPRRAAPPAPAAVEPAKPRRGGRASRPAGPKP